MARENNEIEVNEVVHIKLPVEQPIIQSVGEADNLQAIANK